MKLARRITLVAFAVFALSVAITVISAIKHSQSRYVGSHAFVSADVATMARTFSREGFWKLRGVPVNNNPPIGPEDGYTHWPPLLPILLGVCFRLFGSTVLISHILMLAVLLSTALLITRLGWLWLGPIGGALAGYFWLTLPAVAQFGDLVAQQSLAVLFVTAAVLAFYTGRDALGGALLFLGVFSSWEACLVVPGIWLAASKLPAARRSAVIATLAAGGALICIASLYAIGSPGFGTDTIQTVKYYMGLSPIYSHILPHDHRQLNFREQVSGIIWNHVWMLGLLGTAAIIQLLIVRPKNGRLVLSALAAPWLIWTIVMRTHVAVHDFELLIAAPLTALALAWLATSDLRLAPSNSAYMKAAVFVGLAALQMVILPTFRPQAQLGDYSSEALIVYADQIKNATEPDAIVLTPLLSSVPLFYSDRHIVRGISNDDELTREMPTIRREFAGMPIYLAVPPFLAKQFVGTFAKGMIVASTPGAIVIRIAS
jgi:hypothetical protein